MKKGSSWFALCSALLALAAFAPFNLGPLVFVGLTPLLLRLGEQDVRPFRCGYGFGLIYGFGQLFFIAQLTYRWTHSGLLAAIPFVIATILYALYFGLTGWLINRCWKLGLPWLIPVVWSGVEVLRSYIPVFAFPWGLLASPMWRYPSIIQSAHYLTIFGVSGLALLVNTILASWARDHSFDKVRPMLIAAACTVFVPVILAASPVHTRTLRVTAGQPGVDLAFNDTGPAQVELAANVRRLEEEAMRDHSGLLVLPEGLIQAGTGMPPTLPFPVRSELPMIFGGQRGEKPAYQSAFGFDGTWSVADKTRLVIFGEFVPRWIPFLDSFNLPTGDMSSGEKVQALTVGGVSEGPLVCFEELFPDLGFRQTLNGSQLLAVISMDSWFMGSNAPDQLRAGAVWRAVETARPVVRSATTGYSFICDSQGRMLAEAPLGGIAAVTHDIQVPDPAPVWWLPVFPLLSLFGSVLVGVLRLSGGLKGRRMRGHRSRPPGS